MGTTVTGIYWLGERMAVVHVGDSRAYLLRDGELSQITHDHTYVQTLVDAGRITEEEAMVHPRRSLIMRALDGNEPGRGRPVGPRGQGRRPLHAVHRRPLGVVGNAEIAAVLREGDATGAVTRLVDLALERGAPDNVTVVVADVVDVPDAGPDVRAVDDLVAPVVVGAAGEPRVRLRLPSVRFPDDAQPDPDRPEAPPTGRRRPAHRTPGAESTRRSSCRRRRTHAEPRATRLRRANGAGAIDASGGPSAGWWSPPWPCSSRPQSSRRRG